MIHQQGKWIPKFLSIFKKIFIIFLGIRNIKYDMILKLWILYINQYLKEWDRNIYNNNNRPQYCNNSYNKNYHKNNGTNHNINNNHPENWTYCWRRCVEYHWRVTTPIRSGCLSSCPLSNIPIIPHFPNPKSTLNIFPSSVYEVGWIQNISCQSCLS